MICGESQKVEMARPNIGSQAVEKAISLKMPVRCGESTEKCLEYRESWLLLYSQVDGNCLMSDP